jgi:cytochrome P450
MAAEKGLGEEREVVQQAQGEQLAEGVEALILGRPEALIDPYALYREIRREGPVHEHGDLVLLLGYEDVKEAYRDGDSFARGQTRGRHLLDQVKRLPASQQGAWRALAGFSESFMLRSRHAEHDRLRKTAHRAFTTRRIGSLDGAIRARADALSRRLRDADEVDLVPFAYEMPLAILMEMLGIPDADRSQVHAWSNAITLQIGSVGTIDPGRLLAAHAAMAEFCAYIEAMHAANVAGDGGGSDLLADLLDAEGDGRISASEVASMYAELLIAGHETTTALIGNGMLELLRRPQQWRWLCAHPEAAPDALEEVIRFVSPVATNPRATAGPREFGGRTYPAGTTVLPLIAAANRDPAVFVDPDELDLRRENARQHIGFGFGTHFCIGNQLARREAAAAIGAIARDHPDLRLIDDSPSWAGTVMLRRPDSILVTSGA